MNEIRGHNGSLKFEIHRIDELNRNLRTDDSQIGRFLNLSANVGGKHGGGNNSHQMRSRERRQPFIPLRTRRRRSSLHPSNFRIGNDSTMSGSNQRQLDVAIGMKPVVVACAANNRLPVTRVEEEAAPENLEERRGATTPATDGRRQ